MKIAPSIKRFGFGAAAALVLTSCLSEMPRPFLTNPDQPVFVPSFVPVVTSPVTLASARVKSNRIKYSNSGRKATTAQSGDVILQVRALQAKNGVTTFEATSGEFEVRPGVDVIEKATLRVLTAADATPIQAWPNSAQWQYTMLGLAPGDLLHLQASVNRKGISRTEIFRVTDTVYRRPDLAVMALGGPTTANVGMPVMFFVTVGELNGDHAARTSCRLSVNGAQVDVADNIWVDKGDMVTCQFAHVFSQPGTYTVTASADNVSPADWDPVNNSATQYVTVLAPGTPIAQGTLRVTEEARTTRDLQTRAGQYPVQLETVIERMISTVRFESEVPEAVPYPLQRVEAKLTTDTGIVFDTTVTQLMAFETVIMGEPAKCTILRQYEHEIQVCTKTRLDGTFVTRYDYYRTSGTVTYYGQNLWCEVTWCQSWSETRPDEISGSGQRLGLTAGSQVRVEFAFVDATGEPRVVDRTVAMLDVSDNGSGGYCDPPVPVMGTMCYSWERTGVVLVGEVKWP